ncbi:hypothetical protein AAZV13_03G181000 [Glycine max]
MYRSLLTYFLHLFYVSNLHQNFWTKNSIILFVLITSSKGYNSNKLTFNFINNYKITILFPFSGISLLNPHSSPINFSFPYLLHVFIFSPCHFLIFQIPSFYICNHNLLNVLNLFSTFFNSCISLASSIHPMKNSLKSNVNQDVRML